MVGREVIGVVKSMLDRLDQMLRIRQQRRLHVNQQRELGAASLYIHTRIFSMIGPPTERKRGVGLLY